MTTLDNQSRETRTQVQAREAKLLRVLEELDEAVERGEAKGLEVEARRADVDKGLKEVLRKLEGCKRKERELKEAREAMRVDQRNLEGFKER